MAVPHTWPQRKLAETLYASATWAVHTEVYSGGSSSETVRGGGKPVGRLCIAHCALAASRSVAYSGGGGVVIA
jgi:hypothetical protein